MNCLAPFQVRKSDGSFVPVPCGKCPACRERERNDWFQRLLEEWRSSISSFFVTWTYDDDHLPMDGVQKSDIFKTKDLWKYYLEKLGIKDIIDHTVTISDDGKDKEIIIYKFRPKVSYFIVSEYGDNNHRPHYHGLLFTNFKITSYDFRQILWLAWQKCDPLRLDCDVLTSESGVNYVCGYVHSRLIVPDGQNKNFRLMSRSLGYTFLEDAYRHGDILDKVEPFYFYQGHKLHLCRFYRDRLLTGEDKNTYNNLIKEFQEERDSYQFAKNSKFGQPFKLDVEQKNALWRQMAKKYKKKHH